LPRIETVVGEEEEVVVPALVVVGVPRSPPVVEEIVVLLEDSILAACFQGEFIGSDDARRSTNWIDGWSPINANVTVRVVGRSAAIRKTLSRASSSVSAQTTILVWSSKAGVATASGWAA
jgi:hypothetical protein